MSIVIDLDIIGSGGGGHTVDVTVENPFGVLYILGNEFTDGSQRLIYDTPDGFPRIEHRVSGVWGIGPMVFGDAGYVIDGTDAQFVFVSRQTSERVRVGLAA